VIYYHLYPHQEETVYSQSYSRSGGINPHCEEAISLELFTLVEEQQSNPSFLFQRETGGTAKEWLNPLVSKRLIAVIADPFRNYLTESQ
jgi:hypothetical protein